MALIHAPRRVVGWGGNDANFVTASGEPRAEFAGVFADTHFFWGVVDTVQQYFQVLIRSYEQGVHLQDFFVPRRREPSHGSQESETPLLHHADKVHNDHRYEEAGIPAAGRFVQDNLSRSTHGVLRGLHFQNPHGQGKLVSVLEGEVFDVAVDIRVGSPTFGQWAGTYLSAENHRQLYVPPDFAHGFAVTGASALFSYKCTDYYTREAEGAVLWNDPDIGIDWPLEKPTLSEKDRAAPPLNTLSESVLPRYKGA